MWLHECSSVKQRVFNYWSNAVLFSCVLIIEGNWTMTHLFPSSVLVLYLSPWGSNPGSCAHETSSTTEPHPSLRLLFWMRPRLQCCTLFPTWYVWPWTPFLSSSKKHPVTSICLFMLPCCLLPSKWCDLMQTPPCCSRGLGDLHRVADTRAFTMTKALFLTRSSCGEDERKASLCSMTYCSFWQRWDNFSSNSLQACLMKNIYFFF